MRASDADLAEGRLTADEHAERLDAVYQARTYAELAPVVADLPAMGGTPPVPAVHDDLSAPQAGMPNLVAIFSGAERKGRWLVEPQTNVVAVFGGVELDLRQAVLSQREITINIVAIFGGVSVTVPPGVRVSNSLVAILGGCSLPPEDATDPEAPLVRLTGFAMFGGIDVKRRDADDGLGEGAFDREGLHARQRHIHREFREKQREVHREFREKQRELRRRQR